MIGLWICGTGGVAPEAEAAPGGPRVRRVPRGLPLQEGFPPGAVRWLDDASLWWVNAARQALGGLGAAQTAQVVGLGWGPIAPLEDLLSKAHAEGFAAMNPAIFPYSVGNAPAGQAGILLGMKGPALTLYAKESGGLSAVVEACRLLQAGMAATCVAGGVDQLDAFLLRILRGLRGRYAETPGEGAHALLIRAGEGPAPGDMARIAGWAARSSPCEPGLFPDAAPLLDEVGAALARRAGWPMEEADWLALPGDSAPLREARARLATRIPGAAVSDFQARWGACGASWAGAAVLGARALAEGRAHRAVLAAFATGGAAVGLALESCRAR